MVCFYFYQVDYTIQKGALNIAHHTVYHNVKIGSLPAEDRSKSNSLMARRCQTSLWSVYLGIFRKTKTCRENLENVFLTSLDICHGLPRVPLPCLLLKLELLFMSQHGPKTGLYNLIFFFFKEIPSKCQQWFLSSLVAFTQTGYGPPYCCWIWSSTATEQSWVPERSLTAPGDTAWKAEELKRAGSPS